MHSNTRFAFHSKNLKIEYTVKLSGKKNTPGPTNKFKRIYKFF